MLHGTYNFKEVSLIFGVQQIEGFEEGSEIVVERAEDTFTKKVDVDGNVTRSRSNNTSGTIKFTLSQFSASNKYLQTIMNLDERSGAGVFPSKVTDNSNPDGELALATESWLTKPSNKGYGNESGPREWIIDCANLNFV